jgi:hypothetical protein
MTEWGTALRQAILLVVALSCLLLAAAARAEIRTLPGGTAEIAVKRIGCSIVIDGHVVMNGICHRRTNIDTADVLRTFGLARLNVR